MKELLTNEVFLGFVVIALSYLVNGFIKIMADRNPEKDIWDRVYSVTERYVAFVEQTFRATKGSKLTGDDKAQLKTQAINYIVDELKPEMDKVDKYILKQKDSDKYLRQILGTIVEQEVIKLKQKLK